MTEVEGLICEVNTKLQSEPIIITKVIYSESPPRSKERINMDEVDSG